MWNEEALTTTNPLESIGGYREEISDWYGDFPQYVMV